MFAIRDATVVVLTALDGRRDLTELLVERALRHDALTYLHQLSKRASGLSLKFLQ